MGTWRRSRRTARNKAASGRARGAGFLALIGGCALALVTTLSGSGVANAEPGNFTTGPPILSHDPVLFILCNWGSSFSYEPNSLSYYNDLWINRTSGGYHSLADYFNQESFGQVDINGSEILDGSHSNNGWYNLQAGSQPTTEDQWAADGNSATATDNRLPRVTDCMNAASQDITNDMLNEFASVVTVTPAVQTTAPGAISVGQTSIPVATVANWPAAPFPAVINGDFNHLAYVTAVNSSTNTLTIGTMPQITTSNWTVPGAPNGTAPGTTASYTAGATIIPELTDDVGLNEPQASGDICDNGANGPNGSGGVFSLSSTAGTCYTLGFADVAAGDPAGGTGTLTEGVDDLVHEVGHSFGFVHSRSLATSTAGYEDCWDQMSFDSCGYQGGPSTLAGLTAQNPQNDLTQSIVGLDAINLEAQGWIPTSSQSDYSSGLGQQTYPIHSISDTGALKNGATPTLDVHVPLSMPVETSVPGPIAGSGNPGLTATWPPTCSGPAPNGYSGNFTCQNSDYMTVEYRQGTTPGGTEDWDYGLGTGCDAACVAGVNDSTSSTGKNDAVVLHLHLPNYPAGPYSFLMNLNPNQASGIQYLPDDGGLSPSFGANADQFADFATSTYIAVNDIDSNTWTADVTVSNNPITSGIENIGQDGGTYGQTVAMEGLDQVNEGPPVPNEPIKFSVGSQSCQGTTNDIGVATCNITLNQAPGNYTETESFGGSEAYAPEQLTDLPFQITPAPLTVTANDASRNYGQSNPAFSATLSGFVNGQNLGSSDVSGSANCTTTAGVTSAPGSYPISCTAGSLSSADYTFGPFDNGTLTVHKAPLKVTANDASRVYGVANPSLSATLSGFNDGQNLASSDVTGSASCSTTAGVTSAPGAYPITCGVGSLSSTDYSFGPFDNGTLTINKAPLTVTANNAGRIYGVPNPSLSATLSGFNDGQNLSSSDVTGSANCTSTAGLPSAPGPYPITCTVGSLSSNDYSFGPFVGGNLTVSQAPLTVTANNATRPYGTPNILGATLSGFTDNQSLATSDVTGSAACSSPATLTSDPGNYPITCTQGTLSSTDYDFATFVPGVLAVTKATTSLNVAPMQPGLLTDTFSAVLTNSAIGANNAPIAGQTVSFSVAGQTVCSGITNATGKASCTTLGIVIELTQSSYQASYGGDVDFLPTSGTGVIPSLFMDLGELL